MISFAKDKMILLTLEVREIVVDVVPVAALLELALDLVPPRVERRRESRHARHRPHREGVEAITAGGREAQHQDEDEDGGHHKTQRTHDDDDLRTRVWVWGGPQTWREYCCIPSTPQPSTQMCEAGFR